MSDDYGQKEGSLKDTLVFSPNTLYGNLKSYDKKVVIARALENMKEANNFLSMTSETMKMQIRFAKRYEVDWHKKLTLPFACWFLFYRSSSWCNSKERRTGNACSNIHIFFVVWYVISLSGEKLVEENLISSIAGMWASSYILLPVGIFLTYKASTDSVIMNVETYLLFFRKIKDYIYRIAFSG